MIPVGENANSVVKSVDYQGHPYLLWKSSNVAWITIV